MKTNLLCLLLLLLVVACAKKDPEPEPTGPCRLAEVKIEGKEPWGNWQKPFYDEQGRLAGVKAPTFDGTYDIISLNYDSEGRRTEMRITEESAHSFFSVKYHYDATGQLESVTYQSVRKQDGSTIPYGHFVHSYSGGKLSSILHTSIDNGQERERRIYEYTFSGDVLIRREDYDPTDGPNASRVVYQFTYDDKKRPAFIGLMPDLDYWRSYVDDFLMPTGQHNVLSFIDLGDYTAGQNSIGRSYQNTYTYNSQGYPVLQIQKFQNGKENRYRYTYSCD